MHKVKVDFLNDIFLVFSYLNYKSGGFSKYGLSLKVIYHILEPIVLNYRKNCKKGKAPKNINIPYDFANILDTIFVKEEKNLLFLKKLLEKESIDFVSPLDCKQYPELLINIYDWPFVLYYRGDISLLNEKYIIAVVGTRIPSSYGIDVVKEFIPTLVDLDVTVVSGLAMGIDSFVHNVVTSRNGKAIAVLPGSVNNVYPKVNKLLYQDILTTGGLIVSEVPPLIKNIYKYFFPKRNRIIAGLSKMTFVIEAGKKSGALITANYATSYSRDVITVPGSIFNLSSMGTNDLIKRGAIPVSSVYEVLKLLGIKNFNKKEIETIKELDKLSEVDYKLLQHIDESGVSLNTVVSESGIPVATVIDAIERLKDLSLIEIDEFGFFRKR